MVMYVDIGNTTAIFKMKIDNEFQLITKLESKYLIVGKYLVQAVSEGLQRHNLRADDLTIVCLCSVRPMWDELIAEFAEYCDAAFYQIKKNVELRDFAIEPYNPKSIGADLLIAGYAMRHLYLNQTSIVVSMGTATTISAIVDHRFAGAIIMPGLATSAAALFNSAQLLHEFEYGYEPGYIGTNTKEAINLGLVNGHYYAIRAHVENIKKHHKDTPIKTVVTGGNAVVLGELFDQDNIELIPDLVFLGMELALQHSSII